jgi:hypothetical protein
MKKLLLVIATVFALNQIATAQYLNLKISDLMIVTSNNDTIRVDSNNIYIENNGYHAEATLVKTNSLNVSAKYQVFTTKTARRSNLKRSSVNVRINYVFTYKGKKQKIKTQRIFYLNDPRKFDEKQKAVFLDGIDNTIIILRYKCEIIKAQSIPVDLIES